MRAATHGRRRRRQPERTVISLSQVSSAPSLEAPSLCQLRKAPSVEWTRPAGRTVASPAVSSKQGAPFWLVQSPSPS